MEPELVRDAELEASGRSGPSIFGTSADEELLSPKAEAARLELAGFPTEDA